MNSASLEAHRPPPVRLEYRPMPLPWDLNLNRLGARFQSLGRALEQPGRLRRKLTGIHLDEDVMGFAVRPYVHAADVRVVLDIGANEGQFARTALQAFPAATIFSFEPLPAAQAALRGLAEEYPGRLEVEAFALGDADGHVDFNVTAFSPSSSILPIEPGGAVPIDVREMTRVPIRRLSEWASSRALTSDIVMKLDVQGYEGNVLRGGLDVLKRTRIVIAETTFTPLYKGQTSLGELCAIMEPLGFRYREAFGVVRDTGSGEPLWQDSVFVANGVK
jgi:FkbM family methyltransferase